MFHYGGYGDYHPHWMTPPPGFQLVPVQPKKPEKKKQQQVTLKVKMCCSKCEEIVIEEIGEVPGVEEVKITDRASSKVVVIGKADSEQVLKKAKKVDKRAKLKEEEKEEEESSTTCSTHRHNCFAPVYAPIGFAPVYAPISFVPVPALEQSGPYRHSQSYGPSSSSYYYPPAPEYYPDCPTWYPYNPWYPY
ncbi:unnamed protein product [Sphagnum troendelagicum]|uniref:HMA domain-containing protein n=1 Tax=Sphagnum troendelagicum TaxID=128251 RepID=A0ABP0TSZ0_9BRYO